MILRNLKLDEFFNYDTNKNNFPMKRTNYEFVGEIYNEKDERHPEHWKFIK
jgi:hypothetical protein